MRKLIKIGFVMSVVALLALTTVSFAADERQGERGEQTDLNTDLNQEAGNTQNQAATPQLDSDDSDASGAETPIAEGARADSGRAVTERRGRSASNARTASDDRGEKWWWSSGGDADDDEEDDYGKDGGKGTSPPMGGKDDD